MPAPSSAAPGVPASPPRGFGGGTPVRYLRSLFVPDDETCFLLYEAASAEAVRETVRRAGLAFERITEAVTGAVSADPPDAHG